MRFAHLIFIHGFWIVAALAAFLWWAFARKRALLQRFAHVEMLRRMMAHVSHRAQHLKAVLLVMALAALVFALMQPQWGFTWENVERRGIDVIVAVDVSRSMLANDIRPSRLDRAKRSILDLLNLMQGDRIGLIAFAGSAFVQCPLTLDYGACKMFVDELEPQLIPRGGTRIGEAIRKAVDAFEGDVKKHRALILITDGEDHQGDALAAAELAKEKGVKIYCIGIGTPEGSPIQITDEHGNTSYLKNSDGQVVLSKLDEDTLKRVALATGGAYVPASSSGIELDEIYSKRIARMEEKDLASTRRRRYEHRFQWPLGLALMLVIIEAVTDDRRRLPRSEQGRLS